MGASVCVRTSGCRQPLGGGIDRTSPVALSLDGANLLPRSLCSVRPTTRPSIRGYSEYESPSLPCLSVCLHAAVRECVRAWSESFTLDGSVGRAPLPAPPPAPFNVPVQGRPSPSSILPSFLPPPRPPSARPSLEKVSFNHWPPRRRFPHQPRLAMDGQSQTVTQWQPLSLVVKSLSLYNMVL